jgi:hypothetical protein
MEDKNKALKEQVKDLLNQIIILTKDIKAPPMFDYSNEIDEDHKDYNAEEAYLYSVGAYCKRAVDSDYEVLYNERQYYNSNCY